MKLHCQKGQGLVEYALILVLVAIVIISVNDLMGATAGWIAFIVCVILGGLAWFGSDIASLIDRCRSEILYQPDHDYDKKI